MERSPSLEVFSKNHFGHWVLVAPSSIVWCASAELCGAIVWDRPSREDTARILEAFENYRNPRMATHFDVLFDARGVAAVDPDALTLLIGWVVERKEELVRRVRRQYSIVADNFAGVTLAGILPVIGDTHGFRIVREASEALQALSRDAVALEKELEAAVAEARGSPPELANLRDLLRTKAEAPTIEQAARALAVSVRTLQRVLQDNGTTFRDEVKGARFSAALELIVHGDDKIANVARRVGLSEGALTQLVRERTGTTPADLRKRHRA